MSDRLQENSMRVVSSMIIPYLHKGKEGYVLVKTRKDKKYGFPAGKIDSFESSYFSSKREVFEETGLIILPRKLIRIYELESERGNHILNIVYFGEVIGGSLKEPDGQEILDLNVFNYDEIYEMELKRELRPSTHKSLEDYLFKGHEYPLNIIRTLFSQ